MAQLIESEVICEGRYRIQSIKGVGRQRRRIIEIEDIERGVRFHGPAVKLERMMEKLRAHPMDKIVRLLCGRT